MLMLHYVLVELVTKEIECVQTPATNGTAIDESRPVPTNKPRLFDQYSATQSGSTPTTPTAVGEFRKYLEMCEQGTSAHLSCLEF